MVPTRNRIAPKQLDSLAQLLRSRYGFHLQGAQYQALEHAISKRAED